MTDFRRQFGQWGLVAGAAEGIGAAFCEELARRGMNVILVDILKSEMESRAAKLESEFQVKTISKVIDLGSENAASLCMEAIRETGCRLLIYNAAYSRVKPFLSAEAGELDRYIDVNARTPLSLAYLFSGWLKSEGNSGGILLMSSLAGLWGTGLVAAYSGTKGFNLLLAEAISRELRHLNIRVSVCVAGATATPGYLGTHPHYGLIRPSVMKPGKVASYALKRLVKRTVIIPGMMNRMTYFLLTRIFPRSVSVRLMNRTMERTYRVE
ncbi:MAG TPA: SDR family NAD(P)-dependent oxidoreductase [Bacteroidales bacterium]|nr:SDR family NAD(P)-dependent oxidoreductase [Bacteroidales bacterium]HOX76561.1 SDR family NAD(P)-dependent oxidoreductase [Bacteroidales bacterium]HPI85225.1 SDR family NAD(P)-dependent oxidoreductase [Bacteroidales bacterium]HPM92657.1 SDR family NAD(P)-dependent oxidoreductase [Bacteroidales bacterium]